MPWKGKRMFVRLKTGGREATIHRFGAVNGYGIQCLVDPIILQFTDIEKRQKGWKTDREQ